MSVKNGLLMDWAEWSGQFHTSGASYAVSPGVAAAGTAPVPANRVTGQLVPSVGSILVLKPSQDISLQEGQSPGLVGNFTLQFSLQVYNNTNYTITPTITTITANSGFFESIRGSSRIIKGVLSEGNIINAPLAAEGTSAGLERCVGGLSFGSLANAISRAKKAYDAASPAISAVSQAVPGVTAAVRGSAGAGGAGAGTGAGTGGRRGHRSLEQRLM